MTKRIRRLSTCGATAFMLAGAAAFTAPEAAAAPEPVIVGGCGGSAQGAVGQPVQLRLPLLPPIDLGPIEQGTSTLSAKVPAVGTVVDTLCEVTVTGINAAAAPVRDAVAPVADGAGRAVTGLVPGAKPSPGPQTPPGDAPAPQRPGPRPQPESPQSGPHPGLLTPNSPTLGGDTVGDPFSLRHGFGGGFSPAGGLATSADGLFSPAAGLRYGGQVPGYAPDFGVLGQKPLGGQKNPSSEAEPRELGQAQAIPQIGDGDGSEGMGLSVLLAALALSGVSAALVRTWVLRRS